MNRAADAILAEQIPSSSSPFATSAQAFPPQKTHFLSPKKMDPRPLTFFSLFFTLPFLMEELLLLKSCTPIVDLFPSRKLVLPHPTQDWHLAQLGCAQHPEPKVPSWFSVFNTVFVHELCTGGGGTGEGGGGISREFPSGEHLKSDRAGAASIHPSIAVGRTTKPVGAGGRGRQCSGL